MNSELAARMPPFCRGGFCVCVLLTYTIPGICSQGYRTVAQRIIGRFFARQNLLGVMFRAVRYRALLMVGAQKKKGAIPIAEQRRFPVEVHPDFF